MPDRPDHAAGSTDDAELLRATHSHAARWPYRELDVQALKRDGWRPTPFQDIVFKIHQRCNLVCDYCYVYHYDDQSWRDRPKTMSESVWLSATTRLHNHIRTHGVRNLRVILHGGEPLLYGAARLEKLVSHVRGSLASDCTINIGLQTNAVLLDSTVLTTLRRCGISVGVSVDGAAADHDRHRRLRNGRGSFDSVRKALDLLRLPENRPNYAGILCTISPAMDAMACYEQLLAFEPPMVDFLLPHANWRTPPSRAGDTQTPHADWLMAVFDRWYDEAPPTRIRLFEDIISLLLGGNSRSEQVGLSPAAMIVIESDGAIEQVDALKSAYPGACATGLNVLHDELDSALEDPGVVARQIGRLALADQCLQCPLSTVCGGGHYAHRYDANSGFRNPSVYCLDMKKLIGHIRGRLSAGLLRLPTAVS